MASINCSLQHEIFHELYIASAPEPKEQQAFGATIRDQIVGRGHDNALANPSFILTPDIPTD